MADQEQEEDKPNHIQLTEMAPGYAGLKRIEILGFSKAIHEDGPGMYLQIVNGCGYDVYNLTLEQGEALAEILKRKAEEVRKEFSQPV